MSPGSAMTWTIEFGGDPQDVTVVTSGVASRDGFLGFNAELALDQRWLPGMSVLLDHSSLDMSRLTGPDVEAISDFVVELGDRFGPCACAIVAPDAYARGITDVSIEYLTPTEMTIRTFRSHADAEGWLRDPTTA